VSVFTANAFAIASIAGGIVWLGALSIVRAWRHKSPPSAGAILCAGLCWSYLVLPLAHYIFATPANIKYITTSSNFFAYAPEIQMATWVVAGILAIGARLGNKIKSGGSE
jgi:hypothetical protein